MSVVSDESLWVVRVREFDEETWKIFTHGKFRAAQTPDQSVARRQLIEIGVQRGDCGEAEAWHLHAGA
jgi:hypothetical protein